MSTWGIGKSLFKEGRPYEEYKRGQNPQARQAASPLDYNVILPLKPPTLREDLVERVVGIVPKTLFDAWCHKQEEDYIVSRQLCHVFKMKVERLHNLDPACRLEPVLPEGTGIAISEDLVLTAGHVVPLANPSSYVVVQFEVAGKVAGNALHQGRVYEIEEYIDTRCGVESDAMTVDSYASNLTGGDWAILKLKRSIRGERGPLSSLVGRIADQPQQFAPGKKVVTLGHPHGLPLREAEGTIVPFPGQQAESMVVKYEAETLPGMSGGPVFDKVTNLLLGLHLRGHLSLMRQGNTQLGICVSEPTENALKERGLFGEFFQSVLPVMQRVRRWTDHLDRPPPAPEGQEQLKQAQARELALAKALAEEKKRAEELRQELEQLKAMQKNSNPASTQSPPRPPPIAKTEGPQASRAGTIFSMAFGAAEWAKYFGDVGVEPPLPPNIDTILNGPCPIWSGKKVYETHLLTLIPNLVNGQPLTLDLLEQLIQHPRGGGKETKYQTYGSKTKKQFGNTSAPASHWVLMTRDVLEGTRDKSYDNQKTIAAKYRGYEVPRVLEAATSILMEHVKTGNRLYGDNPLTYTRCQELVDGRYPLVVGGFAPAGLGVDAGLWGGYDSHGLGVLRKF